LLKNIIWFEAVNSQKYPPTFEGFSLESGDIKNVEFAREAFGLLIIFLE